MDMGWGRAPEGRTTAGGRGGLLGTALEGVGGERDNGSRVLGTAPEGGERPQSSHSCSGRPGQPPPLRRFPRDELSRGVRGQKTSACGEPDHVSRVHLAHGHRTAWAGRQRLRAE
eukprot:scaffold34009_cov90-Isochrysis_galbana.AAC.2